MRILHTESSPNWGGQEMRILEQVRWLNAHGHEAWVAAKPGSEILKHALAEHLPCFEVPFRGNLNPAAVFRLHRLVRKHRIDVVDTHSSRDASHCLPLGFLGATVVRTLHLEVIKRRTLHRFIWNHGVHRVIVVSEVLKHRLESLGLGRAGIDVINEGIELGLYDPGLSGEHIRREFGIPASSKVIINIGMIRPDKGQRYFVEAAAAIAARHPEVRFMIVGAGTRPEFEQDLRARIEASAARDKFILTGFRADTADLIAAADCVVVSSLQEAHSRVVPQAFAMKRPVVATNVGGLPDLVRPGVTGTLVAPADPAALAAAVADVLDKDNRNEVDNAYAMARERFDFDGMMARTLATYEKALARRRMDRPTT